jgi:predicted NBD/HSP70 family sugar kinase
MALKPSESVMGGLAVGSVVYAIYSNATPPITDIRASAPNDDHIAASRKQAAIMSAGIVGAISLIAKDATIFIIGGGIIIAMDWWTRHANATNPKTGKITGPGTAPTMTSAPVGVAGQSVTDMPMDYGSPVVAA